MIWKAEILNHLWQSTMFAAAVAIACAALRKNSPRLRYWLWLAASMKFLIPFSLLVSTGARAPIPHGVPTFHAVTVEQISTYFAPIPAARTTVQWPLVLWVAGSLLLLARWFRNWRATKTATLEPGVFGIFRPELVLPEGLAELLTEEQMQAVLTHESRHIECFDNLTAALHMVVETLFWFHPLVWWIGARMMEERERDCDEAVLRRGNQPGAYARSIVQVCQTYVESPLACTSGISGSDLKKRIREIMTWRASLPVSLRAKAMLAVATLATVSVPFVIGRSSRPDFTSCSRYMHTRPSPFTRRHPGQAGQQIGPGPQGGWRVQNMSALSLIEVAYNVADYQIIDAPGWVSSENFDVTLHAG